MPTNPTIPGGPTPTLPCGCDRIGASVLCADAVALWKAFLRAADPDARTAASASYRDHFAPTRAGTPRRARSAFEQRVAPHGHCFWCGRPLIATADGRACPACDAGYVALAANR